MIVAAILLDRSLCSRQKFRKMALRIIRTALKKPSLRNVLDISVKRPMSELSTCEPKDKITHTGQKFDDNDYRRVRFLGKEKLVNPNWGIKLVNEIPPIQVNGRIACCDGGSGPTGHPKVYINLDKPGNHSCLYCGLRFCKAEQH